jgi:predicted dehydrogenase
MINAVLIGYGHLGKWHADKISSFENVNFIAIVEMSEKHRELALEKHPEVKVVASLDEVEGLYNTAVIVTPTSTHYNIAKCLIEKNINVFCEKPVCSTFSQAKELKELSAGKDITLQVGHSERFHEIWDIKKDKINEFFTNKFALRINRYAPFKGRATDVDVVQDLMIHDIDLMLYLTKKKPVSVSAIGFKSLTDKWDHVQAIFSFGDGAIANIVVGRNSTKEVRELEVNSNNGSLLIDLYTCKTYETMAVSEDDKYVRESFYSKRDHLMEEHKCFYNSITNKTPAIVNIDDGLNAVELIEKTLESIESNSTIEF